jgi:hypothetical protein
MDYDTMLRRLEEIEQWAWGNSETAKAADDEDKAEAWNALADVVSDAQGFARGKCAIFADAPE